MGDSMLRPSMHSKGADIGVVEANANAPAMPLPALHVSECAVAHQENENVAAVVALLAGQLVFNAKPAAHGFTRAAESSCLSRLARFFAMVVCCLAILAS